MKIKFYIPLIFFALVGIAFYVGLSLSPTEIPSAKVGKQVPTFSLPPLYEGGKNFSSTDLEGHGIVLMNVFASWCVPCREEHPVLMALNERGVTIHALNYKDKTTTAQQFLEGLGNPFHLIGQDLDGRVGIDWGTSGVPETYVINNEGLILYQHIGPLTRAVVMDEILPLLEGGE